MNHPGISGEKEISVAASLPQATDILLNGHYAGAVAIDEPVALGIMDLTFDLTDDGGVLSGRVEGIRTQVYRDSPTLSGLVTSSTDVITPTFRIDSTSFGGVVSGRTLARTFTLTGEVLDGGNVLEGEYEEVIREFTPEPMMIRGTFLVRRPALGEGTEG